jgi:hypothetical protein
VHRDLDRADDRHHVTGDGVARHLQRATRDLQPRPVVQHRLCALAKGRDEVLDALARGMVPCGGRGQVDAPAVDALVKSGQRLVDVAQQLFQIPAGTGCRARQSTLPDAFDAFESVANGSLQ